MISRLLAVMLLMTSCATYHLERVYHTQPGLVNMEDAVAFGEKCYVSETGIPIFQFEAQCPSKKVLDADLFRLFKRLGKEDLEPFKTLRITFVSKNIVCGPYGKDDNLEVHGCSNPATNEITVRLSGTRASWSRTTAHEIGHFVILWDFPESHGDPGHIAVPVWHLIEAIDDE